MDAQWYADRTYLRTLLQTQPQWTLQDYADATQRSLGWVKKWVTRLRAASPDDVLVLHSQSRARKQPPARLSPIVIARILAIRDHPPAHLHRTPGPTAIRYYLEQDPELRALQLRLPRSTRTIWQILRQHGRIALPSERRHQPVERPAPMAAWQLDFKDVSSVPADPLGKQQHVVEVLNTVDMGTSLLVNAQVREDFTAETAVHAVIATLHRYGVPESITIDRDPRFVGSAQGRDFPAPLVRLLHCLGVQVIVCPPRRPDKNAFVERYNRTYEYEGLRVYAPTDIDAVRAVTATFHQHYNHERPNQARTCGNQPPACAFPHLPPRPPLPPTVDPDRWLAVLDGQRYVRKVRANGTVLVDRRVYYVDATWAGKYVSLQIAAAQRSFIVEYREQPIKQVPIKGLIGEHLPLEVYLTQIAHEARTQMVIGRPIGQQLRLL